MVTCPNAVWLLADQISEVNMSLFKDRPGHRRVAQAAGIVLDDFRTMFQLAQRHHHFRLQRR